LGIFVLVEKPESLFEVKNAGSAEKALKYLEDMSS